MTIGDPPPYYWSPSYWRGDDLIGKNPDQDQNHFVDFHHEEQRIAALENKLARQQKINEALFSLIIASPIEPAQRSTALEMYERAIKE